MDVMVLQSTRILPATIVAQCPPLETAISTSVDPVTYIITCTHNNTLILCTQQISSTYGIPLAANRRTIFPQVYTSVCSLCRPLIHRGQARSVECPWQLPHYTCSLSCNWLPWDHTSRNNEDAVVNRQYHSPIPPAHRAAVVMYVYGKITYLISEYLYIVEFGWCWWLRFLFS